MKAECGQMWPKWTPRESEFFRVFARFGAAGVRRHNVPRGTPSAPVRAPANRTIGHCAHGEGLDKVGTSVSTPRDQRTKSLRQHTSQRPRLPWSQPGAGGEVSLGDVEGGAAGAAPAAPTIRLRRRVNMDRLESAWPTVNPASAAATAEASGCAAIARAGSAASAA